jgi:hypothetical protein
MKYRRLFVASKFDSYSLTLVYRFENKFKTINHALCIVIILHPLGFFLKSTCRLSKDA